MNLIFTYFSKSSAGVPGDLWGQEFIDVCQQVHCVDYHGSEVYKSIYDLLKYNRS
jgi:hypothetical protein